MKRHYNIVTFGIKKNSMMLLFVSKNADDLINEYFLIMRSHGGSSGADIHLEMDEITAVGKDCICEAELLDFMLVIRLYEPQEILGGDNEIIITFDNNKENMAVVKDAVSDSSVLGKSYLDYVLAAHDVQPVAGDVA